MNADYLTDKNLCGVIPATITPIRPDGRLDTTVLRKHIDYLIGCGVHGVFLAGTAGEGLFLTAEQRIELYGTVREIVGDRVALTVAFIRPDTRSVMVEMREFAQQFGSDGPEYVSAVAPLYYPVDQDGLVTHFESIADAAPAPLIIYNIPGNTHNPLGLGAIKRLSVHRRIAGIKESSGDFALFSQGLMEQDSGTQFAWLQGKDNHDGHSLVLGAPGLITGLGNVWIEPYVRMYNAFLEGDTQTVISAQCQINALSAAVRSAGSSPIPAIKAAAAMRWNETGQPLMPALQLTDQAIQRIRAAVTETIGESLEK